ncbi:MAG: transketolase [Pseudomonadota bacterium]|nr:transketolase [Pseudomonadota bacterium]
MPKTKNRTDFDIPQMANAIRFLSVDAVQKAKSGHPGMPMGMAEVAAVLYSKFMKFDVSEPNWADRDRFILSAGHGSMLLYSILYLTGYEDVGIEQIKLFRQLGSSTAGHPEYGLADGIETTTGPLGQGLGMAVGMALAERIMNSQFGDELVDHYTYVVAGDGCLMEGISHEAISFAGHFRLNKLIVFFDDNSISIDGATDLTVSDDQLGRFDACGWEVIAVDGHDALALESAISKARKSDRPSLIACRTVIGFGSPNLAGSSAVHGSPLGEEEIKSAKQNLNWNFAPFDIPDEVLNAWRDCGVKNRAELENWNLKLSKMESQTRQTFMEMFNNVLPIGWLDKIIQKKKQLSSDAPNWATRKASGEVLETLAGEIPQLIGGSADLTGSNNTMVAGSKAIKPGQYDRGYIHYGVREFGMGAIMNGLALHGGCIPYGGTFLVFADYMRPAIRLSALMGQRVIYVLTHDSIGLGEDGPTHQPVETLSSLRAVPNLNVFRPADPVEVAECWALAIESLNTPSVIALTRQGVPTLRIEHTDNNLSSRGAYIISPAKGKGTKVILLATGSEVSIALSAQRILEDDGITTAVVSMPCWELFDQQEAEYRKKVLRGDVRVAIEAAVKNGWEKYIGENGGFVGMQSFGESAPAEQLFKHFDITAGSVVNKVKGLL